MKKFLQILFMTLGVIFFIIIIAGVYLYVADPYEIKPLIKSLTGQTVPTTTTTNQTNDTTSQTNNTVNKNSLLSPTQEESLKKIGIDPTVLPSEITPEMEQCFYAKLGEKRANEIKAGSEPTTADYFAARSCL